jgi:divalent metal cation (Fe/Co/Zn/Cd) transporter
MRWVGVLIVPTVMLAVAGFLVWYGTALINDPAAGASPWLGWLLVGAAALKAALWLFVATGRIRLLRRSQSR